MTKIFDNFFLCSMFRHFSSPAMYDSKMRFLIPLSLVLVLKLFVAWAVYFVATLDGGHFATFWMKEWGIHPNPDWPLLFHGWDSAWYIRIAETGYSYPAYAFFPAYPYLIRLGSLLTGEYFISSFMISFVLGILAVPMFQMVAEHYMSRNEAIMSALFFGLFPPVFLFTGVAYTESLFAVAVIGTWLLCLKKRHLSATVSAVVATATKVYGFLVSVPLALRLLREGRRKDAALAVLATLITFGGWNAYLFHLTGDLGAYSASQSHWQKGWPFGISSLLRFILEMRSRPSQLAVPDLNTILIIAVLSLIIVLFGGLVFSMLDLDEDFSLYALIQYLFLIAFGTVWSFVRFFPFVLPVWLMARTRSRSIKAGMIVVSPIVSFVMWYQFVVLGVWFG